MSGQGVLPTVEDRAVWVTCPSCGGIWCRTHDIHIDQCACPVSPVKRRVSWLDPAGTDKTPKELAREFIHWRCDRMDQGASEDMQRVAAVAAGSVDSPPGRTLSPREQFWKYEETDHGEEVDSGRD